MDNANGTCAENTGRKLHGLPLSAGEPDLVSLFLLAPW